MFPFLPEVKMDLSIIIPVYNEEECIESVLREVFAVTGAMRQEVEVIAVDDGSTDSTPCILKRLSGEFPDLRVFRLNPNSGQSAALAVGFRRAEGQTVVMMDADGQNDPEDIPRLVEGLTDCDMCCGYRADRKDTWSKRTGSKLANRLRSWLLSDGIIDTGCTLKAVKTSYVRELPIWHGMHRFIPALAMMEGAKINQVPVNHRERAAGTSKYTNFGRLKVTVADLFAVRWMQKRHRRYQVEKCADPGNQ